MGPMRLTAFLFILLILIVNILSPTLVDAQTRATLDLSVRLNLEPPLTLHCLGPVTLMYQPETKLARKPHLPLASWREVEGGLINPQLKLGSTDGRRADSPSLRPRRPD